MSLNPLDLKNCVCANVRNTDRALTGVYDQVLRPAGLTAAQFALLSVLAEVGTIRVTDLARFMVMDQTTVTRNVDLLKKNGLVQAEATQDKRVRVISLTDQGSGRHAEATELWTEVQTRLSEGLGPARLQRFLEDLTLVRKLLPRLKVQEKE